MSAEQARSSVLSWLRKRDGSDESDEGEGGDEDEGGAPAETQTETAGEQRVAVLEKESAAMLDVISKMRLQLGMITTRARLCHLQQTANECHASGQQCASFSSRVGGRDVTTTVYPCYSQQAIEATILKHPDACITVPELWDGAVAESEGWVCANKSIHPVEDTIEQVRLATKNPPRDAIHQLPLDAVAL